MRRPGKCPRKEPSSRAERHVSIPQPSASAISEAGYVLVGVIFFVALILLSLAIAAPKVAAAIQRDRELELIHRGEQYKRAIKLYYKKFGSYPSTMEQLEKTNNIRFLRKRYVDPLTGKDDWKLIHMGEAHLHPLGFFGKPLSATSPLGGAGGLNGGTSTTLGQGSQTGQSLGTSSSGSSGTLGGTTSAPGGSGGGGMYAGVDNSGTSGSGSGSGSGTGSGSGSGSGSTTSGSTGFGASTSQTLGGAPIVGIVVASTKTTIVEYKLQKTYKDWEFVYDPVEEQAVAAGSLLGGSANLNGSSGTSGGIGGSSTGTGFGSTGTTTGAGGTSGGIGSGSTGLGGSSGSGGSTGFGGSGGSSGTGNPAPQ